jgi:hypothetical protein
MCVLGWLDVLKTQLKSKAIAISTSNFGSSWDMEDEWVQTNLGTHAYAAFADFIIMFKSMAISDVGCGEMIEIKTEPIFQMIWIRQRCAPLFRGDTFGLVLPNGKIIT